MPSTAPPANPLIPRTERARQALLEKWLLEHNSAAQEKLSRAAHSQLSAIHAERLSRFISVPYIVKGGLRKTELCYSQTLASDELIDLQPEAIARAAVGWLRNRDQAVQREAVLLLAWIGGPKHIPLILRSLKSSDPAMVASAADGITRACEENRLRDKDRKRVTRALIPIVTGVRRFPPDRELEVLLEHAVTACVAVGGVSVFESLISAQSLSPDNPCVRHILLSIRSASNAATGVPAAQPKADRLWRIADAAKQRKLHPAFRKYADQVVGLSLLLAAPIDPERTRLEAGRFLDAKGAKNGLGCDLARQALRSCKKLPEPRSLLACLNRTPGRFNADAAAVIRTFAFTEYLKGDGLLACLIDDYSTARSAVSGLKLIGLKSISVSLGKTVTVPTIANAATARARGRRTAADLPLAELKLVSRVEDAIWNSLDRIESAIHTYIAAHVADFTTERQTRKPRS